MSKRSIGIDISRNHLDAHCLPEGRSRRFTNDPRGFEALIDWVGSDVDCIAHEPTGPWHREFEETLQDAGLPLKRMNPYRVRCFARALGMSAKTDAIDARVLACMADTAHHLPLTPVRSQLQRDLAELQTAREALVGDRTALLNRSKHLRLPLLQRQNRDRRRSIERQITRIDTEIGKLFESDDSLARRVEILTSIPGISHVIAAGLLAHMPELGELNRSTAASLAGLAPVTRESGLWKGRSFIGGGRRRVRSMLYMPALAAIRFNPDLRNTYRSLKDAGKPSKVAITCVMRKLVVLANALLQQNRLWERRGLHAAP